jgi:predicted permease
MRGKQSAPAIAAMTTLVFSLLSVFAVILAGFAARRSRLIDDAQWRGFEAVSYHVLIPALVIHTLATARLGALPILPVGAAMVLAALAMSAFLLVIRPRLARSGLDGPGFTSLFQGAVRWNTFIAIALAAELFGAEGTALMAVVIATLIPVVNILTVLVMSRYAQGKPFALGPTLVTLAKNPFIWSCAVGLLANPVVAFAPTPLLSAVEIIGRGALAAGLLVAGAGLEWERLKRPQLAHGLAVGLKLLVMPALVFTLGLMFGLSGAAFSVAMIAATVPTAGASYILARQMGGDAPLMAEIATFQTLAAMVTMPLVLLASAL